MVYAWNTHLTIFYHFLVAILNARSCILVEVARKIGRIVKSKGTTQVDNLSFKKRRKQEALDLAVLIYDIYKEKANKGQNNANQKKKN